MGLTLSESLPILARHFGASESVAEQITPTRLANALGERWMAQARTELRANLASMFPVPDEPLSPPISMVDEQGNWSRIYDMRVGNLPLVPHVQNPERVNARLMHGWQVLALHLSGIPVGVQNVYLREGMDEDILIDALISGLEAVHELRPTKSSHPLAPLVDAWVYQSREIQPYAGNKGIMPAPFGERLPLPGQGRLLDLAHLTPPKPGLVEGFQAYLPNLHPDAPPTPAILLAIFDAGGGQGIMPNGGVSVEQSAFVEMLLSYTAGKRDGKGRPFMFTIREIAEEWMGWNSHHYRATGQSTGLALRKGLYALNTRYVPMNNYGGAYWPISVRAIEGLRLENRVAVDMSLPESQVGPQVNRAVLRKLRGHGPAWRLYLSLCFEWDRYGGHNGRLIRPTRPEVLRADGGQVVNAQGNIITGPGGRPVHTPHDPRAIATGKREPNPERTRYPEYSLDDLARMSFSESEYKALSAGNKSNMRKRALKAAQQIAELCGMTIEQTHHGRMPRYRAMPPDPGQDL